MSEVILETKNLTKYYGKSKGIENVNLKVKKGEVFGFIGPNGSGKSTLIRTLLGLILPTSGSAHLFGLDAIRKGSQAREKIGYVPSEINYYSGMNASELLHYSAGFYKHVDLGKIDQLAERFELDLKKDIDDLSYGNKRKVALIQSVLHNPELLILDEPTGGLDPLMQNRFFELLREEHEKGTSLFFSSHILSEIQRICQRAAIIKNGEIIKEENIQELMKKQMKNCRLVFKEKPESLKLPENAQEENWVDNKLSFEYIGPVSDLMTWIAKHDLLDVTIEEPTLENIFMNYYER